MVAPIHAPGLWVNIIGLDVYDIHGCAFVCLTQNYYTSTKCIPQVCRCMRSATAHEVQMHEPDGLLFLEQMKLRAHGHEQGLRNMTELNIGSMGNCYVLL